MSCEHNTYIPFAAKTETGLQRRVQANLHHQASWSTTTWLLHQTQFGSNCWPTCLLPQKHYELSELMGASWLAVPSESSGSLNKCVGRSCVDSTLTGWWWVRATPCPRSYLSTIKMLMMLQLLPASFPADTHGDIRNTCRESYASSLWSCAIDD